MAKARTLSEISTRGKAALCIGIFSIIIPGMLLAGFALPEHTPPASTCVAIAIIGSSVAGVIAYPRQWLRSSIAGAITGGGSLLGLLLYVIIRNALIESDPLFTIEFAIAWRVGSLPGAFLVRWGRAGKAP